MKALNGLHHITLCVGDKQEDYEFHTQILGLRSVKKTLLYDGKVPIYHLYYGNADGDPGSIVTTFPMRHTGVKGKLGNNQIQGVMLAIPPGASDFWVERLSAHGIENAASERFGEKRISFKHPTGIKYTLVETDAAGRRAWDETNIPTDKGIVGMHGIAVNVREIDLMDEFMQAAWSSDLVAEEGATKRYQMGKGGSGTIVEITHDADTPQGSWMFGEGIVHHCAFDIDSLDKQTEYKAHVEGLGLYRFLRPQGSRLFRFHLCAHARRRAVRSGCHQTQRLGGRRSAGTYRRGNHDLAAVRGRKGADHRADRQTRLLILLA